MSCVISNITHTEIPVIDIAGTSTDATVAKALIDAAATYGFVYIKSQGKDIPIEDIDGTFDLAKKFFSSPDEEKQRCKIAEDVGDFKEAFNLAEFRDGKPQQLMPPSLMSYENELFKFHKHCNSMVLKLLSLFAIGLKIEVEAGGTEWLSSRHQGGHSGTILRLLHYPAIQAGSDFQPSVDIRAGAHSDYGSITLLFQRPGQPGLEIIPPSTLSIDGVKDYSSAASWTPVPVFPPGTESDPSPPILVNIGDLLCYWTNGLLKSTVHRVVFPKSGPEGGQDRYSMAYFAHPVGTTILEPIPSHMVSELKGLNGVGPEGKKVITADEHLMGRLKATYLGLYRGTDDNKEDLSK